MANNARIKLNIFDGTRNPMAQNVSLLVTLRDGNQQIVHRDDHFGPNLNFDVEFFNNFGDNYTVIAFAKNHLQAGFHPVKVSPTTPRVVDLMLLPKKNRLNFAEASWAKLKKNHPKLSAILGNSAANDAEARDRYEEFLDNEPGSLAAFLNIATAVKDIILPVGTALDYFQEVIWEAKTMKQDRFFAYADEALVSQVKQAAAQGEFSSQFGLDITHPGATCSFKQKQFGEANVQFSFHENDTKVIAGVDCVKVELDMDYFQDSLAHLILEVLPNKISNGKTDPRQIYLLRWIAGRHAGVPDFNPPYTIEARRA
jgi:hypothetical protein